MIGHYTAKTEKDMRILAEKLAEKSFPGEFIALFGGLGAGKTTFVRYFAAALGMDAAASPTFTIVRQYASDRASIMHFDCYRLNDADELYMIGFEDYLASNSIVLMEWSENVLDALPENRIELHLSGSGDDPRNAELIPFGEREEKLVEELEL